MLYLESRALGNCHHAEEAGTSLMQVPQETKIMLCPFQRPIASGFSLPVLGALYWQHIPKLHWQGSQRSAISGGYSQSITEGRHYAKIIEILN